MERLEQLDEEPDERGGDEDREQGDTAAHAQAATAPGSPRRARRPTLATDREVATPPLEARDTPRPGGRVAVVLVIDLAVKWKLIHGVVMTVLVLVDVMVESGRPGGVREHGLGLPRGFGSGSRLGRGVGWGAGVGWTPKSVGRRGRLRGRRRFRRVGGGWVAHRPPALALQSRRLTLLRRASAHDGPPARAWEASQPSSRWAAARESSLAEPPERSASRVVKRSS